MSVRRILLVSLLALLVLLVFAVVGTALWLHSNAESLLAPVARSLKDTTGRDLAAEALTLAYFPPGVAAKNVTLSERGSARVFLRVGSVNAGIDAARSWNESRPIITSLALSDVSVELSRGADGRWNIADLLGDPAPRFSLPLELSALSVDGLRVNVTDAVSGERATLREAQVTLDALKLQSPLNVKLAGVVDAAEQRDVRLNMAAPLVLDADGDRFLIGPLAATVERTAPQAGTVDLKVQQIEVQRKGPTFVRGLDVAGQQNDMRAQLALSELRIDQGALAAPNIEVKLDSSALKGTLSAQGAAFAADSVTAKNIAAEGRLPGQQLAISIVGQAAFALTDRNLRLKIGNGRAYPTDPSQPWNFTLSGGALDVRLRETKVRLNDAPAVLTWRNQPLVTGAVNVQHEWHSNALDVNVRGAVQGKPATLRAAHAPAAPWTIDANLTALDTTQLVPPAAAGSRPAPMSPEQWMQQLKALPVRGIVNVGTWSHGEWRAEQLKITLE